jgi:radical SAM superfamily enzyme YgiQ (UPF0313 family)/2-polyprenyl-3-methyl-5-hydroxy-6-metoxy-1,4-benzoquinol methylase
MAQSLRICFIQATNDIDVHWHAPLSFSYLNEYVRRLLPGAIESTVAPNIAEALRWKPDILAISCISQDFGEALRMTRLAKGSGVPAVILGGYHITAFPETLPASADAGVLGEGEATFGEIASAFMASGSLRPGDLARIPGIVYRDEDGNPARTPPRPLIEDLDTLPLPDRKFGLGGNQNPYLFTSRGCPYRCYFCASSRYWSNVRFHGAGRVIAEIEGVLSDFPGTTEIGFWDDLLVANRKRLRAIVSLLEEKGLSRRLRFSAAVRANLLDEELCGLLLRANLRSVGFGAESGSERILRKLKDVNCSVAANQRALDSAAKHGLRSSCGFVLGHHEETEEDVIQTYSFILGNYAAGKLASHEITILTPMPGTGLWDWAEKNGVIVRSEFEWQRLRYLALFSNNLGRAGASGRIGDWINLRRSNRSLYLNEGNVPQEHLYQIIEHYERKIERGDFSAATGGHSSAAPAGVRPPESDSIPLYFRHVRPEIASAVPPDALSILDIGCGVGMLGKALKSDRAGRRVVGIEMNPAAARAAGETLDEVYTADVEQFSPPFARGEFDCVVFADILEHMKDPWALVRHYTSFLAPGGTFVASIPNVRFLGLIGDLAERGTWKYGDEGILDRTHLRFFTKKEFLSLMAQSDICCDSVEYLAGGDLGEVRTVGADLCYGNLALRNLTQDHRGELGAYQMVFTGRYIPGGAGEGALAAVREPGRPLAVQAGEEEILEPELLESELFVSPGDRGLQKRLAASYAHAGRAADAVKVYQELLAADPDDCGVLLGLGDLCVSVNDHVTAAKFFKRVLTLDPANAFAARALSVSPGGAAGSIPILKSRRISGQEEYARYAAEMQSTNAIRQDLEIGLIEPGERFALQGYCHVCRKPVDFTVDYTACYGTNGSRVPNWREQLVCPSCGLNNRSRGALHLLEDLAHPSSASRMFIAEQTTPLYTALSRRFPHLIGSEFLGADVPRGSVSPAGLRNEDLTALSFADGSLDCVLTFDVFEHVPDYRKALRECFRVLAPGGTLMFTVPFDRGSERTIIRAVAGPDGTIRHLLTPEYHGDPVNADAGCLCYQVFGWELLSDLKSAGFDDAGANMYWSRDFGYLGGDQLIFAATKPPNNGHRSAPQPQGSPIRPIPFWDGDTAFNQIMKTIQYTLVDRVRCYMLYQFALQAARLEGDVAEIGVYKGGTARLLSLALRQSGKTIHLFDTFEGMPSTDPDRDAHHKGDFSDTSLESVKRSLEGCTNVGFYPGFFPATAPPVAGLRFSLAHIDVDIYRSVLDCCEFFYPRMVQGGIMVFDDYGFESCPGAKAAVDEFFSGKRERPLYLPSGQCAVIKL